MEMLAATLPLILRRDDDNDPAKELLELLQNPFGGQIQQTSVWVALGSSIGFTVAIAIGFSFIRPHNTVVYAPKLKHADEKHAPPPLGRGILAWIKPLWSTSEQDMVALTGLDAALFMRFTRMCRNLFVVLTVLGCAILVPVNYTKSVKYDTSTWLTDITPMNVYNKPIWATVICAWLFNIIVAVFLWWNYRAVLRLRRQYYESDDYQHSLHARTLMLYDIPKNFASDEGIARLVDSVVPNSSFARTAIARNVKILPELIKEHELSVRELEKVLAKYLKDPANLPAARPMCRPSKKDRAYATYPKGQKVDAIDYLTQRIRELEIEVKEVRASVDKRSSMSYGFASYSDISEAHSIAYTCKKKKPHGTTIALAPRPNDVLWDNMPLSPATRGRRRLVNNLWIALLTFLWVAPNAMIAIFLVNLSNLGHLWPAFQTSLEKDSTVWAIVQGIASPAVTSLVYLLLPIAFRRLSMRAGDRTKTGRERHVIAKLYSFFVFNNLVVFSIFSAIWAYTTAVVKSTQDGMDTWKAILDANFGLTAFLALCNISPFWITWLFQRQLGIAIDLAQLWTLFYSSMRRKFSSPTPRELIELTAPPPFDYASYANYFLFYSTVALCYATIQPIVLPAAALYFIIDVAFRKYLLLYVFVTKTESGGMYWRVLFNRFVFGVILSNLVVFLTAWVRGGDRTMAYLVVPLPVLMVIFKVYCSRTFDDKIHYYSTVSMRVRQAEEALNVKEQSARNDRLAARFGHPALYRPLITPMVHAKAQNMLASVYQGRLSDGREAHSGDTMSTSGYSDTYVMNPMHAGKPGKPAGGRSAVPGFELVPESRLDFEFYKNREEFAEDHGAGELFGKFSDITRTGTPATFLSGPGSDGGSRPGTPKGGMGFSHDVPYSPVDSKAGTAYPRGYIPPAQQPPLREGSLYNLALNDSNSNLVGHAAGMPVREMSRERNASPLSSLALGNPRAPGMLGGGPYGYGGLPQTEEEGTASPTMMSEAGHDPMSYDYFRGGSRTPGPRDASNSLAPRAPNDWN